MPLAPWKSVTPQFHPFNETSFVSNTMLKCCLSRWASRSWSCKSSYGSVVTQLIKKSLTHLANKTVEGLPRPILQPYPQLVVARDAYPLSPFDVRGLYGNNLFSFFRLPGQSSNGDTEL